MPQVRASTSQSTPQGVSKTSSIWAWNLFWSMKGIEKKLYLNIVVTKRYEVYALGLYFLHFYIMLCSKFYGFGLEYLCCQNDKYLHY
jgi:hypothetical protein